MLEPIPGSDRSLRSARASGLVDVGRGPSRGEAAARCGSLPEPQIQHSKFIIKACACIQHFRAAACGAHASSATNCGPPPPPQAAARQSLRDRTDRQNANKFAFSLDLFVSLASPKILSLGKIANKFAFCARHFVSLSLP